MSISLLLLRDRRSKFWWIELIFVIPNSPVCFFFCWKILGIHGFVHDLIWVYSIIDSLVHKLMHFLWRVESFPLSYNVVGDSYVHRNVDTPDYFPKVSLVIQIAPVHHSLIFNRVIIRSRGKFVQARILERNFAIDYSTLVVFSYFFVFENCVIGFQENSVLNIVRVACVCTFLVSLDQSKHFSFFTNYAAMVKLFEFSFFYSR